MANTTAFHEDRLSVDSWLPAIVTYLLRVVSEAGRLRHDAVVKYGAF